jgi:hypothetical protein
MALKKLIFKSGVNRENTRYTSENGWYECDKIRFRQGTPEKIGGWTQSVSGTYLGTCRALFGWVTLTSKKLLAVGTNLKYYVQFSSTLYDITPIRDAPVLNNPFDTVLNSTTVTVNDVASGVIVGDFVTFSGASTVGGLNLNGEYQIVTVGSNKYTITAATPATSTVTGGGGATVTASYQINVGPDTDLPGYGWGSGTYGSGVWGTSGGSGSSIATQVRVWSQFNFGENLIFAPRYGGIYWWEAASGFGVRAVRLDSLGGASDVPVTQSCITISDVSRFVIAFGCNDYISSAANPLLIRWSDQEDATNWTPDPTNQAGSLTLSHGSEIVAVMQTRQEILVWTDSSLYSLQYVGAPIVWGSTLLGDNTSCISPNGVTVASGIVYWMGAEKFYFYNGSVDTLSCDLRQFVFGDINLDQAYKICSGTNEGFNEVWWFYPSANSTEVDRYVVYNYLEKVWYYGTIVRTAWLDSGIFQHPIAAALTTQNLVYHEDGVDDDATGTPQPIEAYVSSAEFDIDDGDHFGFVYRILPDLTFRGSTAETPSAVMTLIPMKNSGSGFSTSVGGQEYETINQIATIPIEEFTGQIFVRVRGRQMILKMASDGLGVTWQLGAPRIDIRQDGRR